MRIGIEMQDARYCMLSSREKSERQCLLRRVRAVVKICTSVKNPVLAGPARRRTCCQRTKALLDDDASPAAAAKACARR